MFSVCSGKLVILQETDEFKVKFLHEIQHADLVLLFKDNGNIEVLKSRYVQSDLACTILNTVFGKLLRNQAMADTYSRVFGGDENV